MDIENFGLNPFPCHPISTKMDNDTEGTDITYIYTFNPLSTFRSTDKLYSIFGLKLFPNLHH